MLASGFMTFLNNFASDLRASARLSVDTIIKKLAVRSFALIKIDIEGGEQDLFDGPIGWLAWPTRECSTRFASSHRPLSKFWTCTIVAQ